MPRKNLSMDLTIPGKIRKRGCSSSASSSSSIIQNYRFNKRAILVGKGGRSTTPVPTWKLISSMRSPMMRTKESTPKYSPSQSGSKANKQVQPLSARKLAATLWEMNEIPSPRVKEGSDERRLIKELRARERVARSTRSGSLPPHLSDPSHSPVSERMDRSATSSRRRGTPIVSHKLRLSNNNAGVLDSLSIASLMETETRSRAQTPTPSTVGAKTHLKDASNALMTLKELLKIINRIWDHENRPSSSMSLVSVLHAELERTRLLINQHIQAQGSDQNEINYLIKCYAEEKAAWKSKEQEVFEAAIESIARELEVEKKHRRKFESLNKRFGKELAETKSSFIKVVKELESEKRAREVIEEVCDELDRNIEEDKSEAEELKRELVKVREEVEKEREMMQIADVLREERVQMKLSEAKHQLEDENAAVDKLRNQLETFLASKRPKEKGHASNHTNNENIDAYVSRNNFGYHHNDKKHENGEVEDVLDCEEDSAESDLHSIELNMDNSVKNYNWAHASVAAGNSRRALLDREEFLERKSTPGKGKPPRKGNSLQRSVSDGVECGIQSQELQSFGDTLDWERFAELERHMQAKDYPDEINGYKSSKGLSHQILSGSRLGSSRVYASPTRQLGQPWPSRDYTNSVQEKANTLQGNDSKSRPMEPRYESLSVQENLSHKDVLLDKQHQNACICREMLKSKPKSNTLCYIQRDAKIFGSWLRCMLLTNSIIMLTCWN